MVSRRLPKQKCRRRFGDLRRLVLVKILSQPQVRAQAKPIKEILAAGCVVHLRTVHEAKITGPDPLSSLVVQHKSEARIPEGGVPQAASKPALTRKIKIRAAHEIMAARTTQLALFVDQLMAALRTISPVLAGNVFFGWCRMDTGFGHGRFGVPLWHWLQFSHCVRPNFFSSSR